MSGPGTPTTLPPPGAMTDERPRGPWRVFLPVGLLGLLTVAAIQVSDGNLGVALAPCVLALLVWAICVLPLRVPMLCLLGLALVLETPGDVFASGLVTTPWRIFGLLLWTKLNLTIPISPLVITGFDLLALLLFAVVIYRRVTKSQLDRTGWIEPPRPIGTFAWISVAAIVWLSVYGAARGGSTRFMLWQGIRFLYMPIIYTLMREALRGPQDAAIVGRVVLGAGLFRGLEAIVLRMMFPSIEQMPHATAHHDSVLFVTCTAILVAMLLESQRRRTLLTCALLAPVYLWAMAANNRRLAWTELVLVLVFFYLQLPRSPVKRTVTRGFIKAMVPLLLYAAVGWNSQAKVFEPVQKLRSIVDSKRDASTLWRDFENYNLVHTYSQNPILGSGFGHPMIEVIKLPDVTDVYELEPYVPHNSVLGLWAFGGLLGFYLLWMIFPVGIFFTLRAYRWAHEPVERVAALGAVAAQLCYLVQGYGDLGFGTSGPLFMVAASYALAGKICTRNGAWKSTREQQHTRPGIWKVGAGGGVPQEEELPRRGLPALPPGSDRE